MTSPPDVEPRTEPTHDEDLHVSNFGWWALGGALGTAVTVAIAFVVLIAMTSESERTSAIPAGGEAEAAVEVAGDAVAEVTLVATEFAFDPAEFVAAPEVEVTLDNQGVVIHNFVVEGVPEAEFVVVAEAGQMASGTLTLDAGDYAFFCSIPGHREAGMEGRLTVASG